MPTKWAVTPKTNKMGNRMNNRKSAIFLNSEPQLRLSSSSLNAFLLNCLNKINPVKKSTFPFFFLCSSLASSEFFHAKAKILATIKTKTFRKASMVSVLIVVDTSFLMMTKLSKDYDNKEEKDTGIRSVPSRNKDELY